MGQLISTAFIHKKVLANVQPAKKRRKGKKRAKSLWERVLSFIFSFRGRNLTNSRISEVSVQSKENIEKVLTMKNEKMEAEREKVPVRTKENIEKELTMKNEKMEAEREKLVTFYSENHSHIICEHGQKEFTTMMSFLNGRDKFKNVDVPGKQTTIKVTQDVVRRLLIGILVRFRHLHFEGKTLNGCFDAESICVPLYEKEYASIAPYIEVKLGALELDSFMSYTEERGNKDLMKLGWILEHQIFSSEAKLPSDVKQLVDLLCDTPIKDKYLIYGHISLMGAREQVSHFLWLYKRLIYLKKKMPTKYKNIIQKITSKEDWRPKAKRNKFLAKLNPRQRYSGDGKGVTRFYRNSVEHLFKLFEDSRCTAEEEKLEDYHIIYILTETFPELLGELQKAFHEEGEFQALTVEDSSEGALLLVR